MASPFVSVTCWIFVLTWRATMRTPGTEAPLESVAVPEIVALLICASERYASRTKKAKKKRDRNMVLQGYQESLQLADYERIPAVTHFSAPAPAAKLCEKCVRKGGLAPLQN